MKFNWKILATSVVIIGIAAWAITAVLPRSFSGSNLTFGVGSGLVAINNPSDTPVEAQLIGQGSRAFNIASDSEGMTGASTREGSGNSAKQLFPYTLAPGTNEFTITRGNNVSFVATTDTRLEATVQPLSSAEVSTTLVIAVVVILVGLFYISHLMEHAWLQMLRRQPIPLPVIETPVVQTPATDPNRGHDGRMYSNYGSKD